MHQALFRELCLYFTCLVLKTILGHKYCYFPHSADIETGLEKLRKLPYTYNINCGAEIKATLAQTQVLTSHFLTNLIPEKYLNTHKVILPIVPLHTQNTHSSYISECYCT